MSIYLVSDLHGAPDDLAAAVPEGATLLLLGDLLNVLDYIEMSGILVEIFSVEAVTEVAELRTAGRLDEARAVMTARSVGREDAIRAEFARLATLQYEQVFAALPDPTYVILGNVDIPPMAASYAARTPGATDADGRVVDLEGERFGFAGGALPSPLNVPGEISEDELRSKISSLGEVDVVCTHIPPAIDDLCFDTLAGKLERGSRDLLEYIHDVKPTRAYFGHVHQPLVSALWVGSTLCVNVGYFRGTKRAVPHIGVPKGERPWQTR